MAKNLDGNLDGNNRRFAIALGRFNSFISERLLEGAFDCLIRHGVKDENITVVRVPGAFELPLAAKMLAAKENVDGVIALGAVIRGATPHFDYVCSQAARGLSQVMMDTGKPVAFGVLTVDTVDQAVERAGTKMGNKGWEAAMACLETVNLAAEIEAS